MSNFGAESNGKVCKCGLHHGVGEWPPEQRAAVYKRMNERMPDYLKDNQKAYLQDWEKHHGIVHYRMDVVGKSTGEFSKGTKGQDVLGPVFVDPYQEDYAQPDIFTPPPRADLDG